MPQPNDPRKPSPEELARQIARRLAEQAQPAKTRFSLHNSVLAGRLISGGFILVTAGALVVGIFAGVDLLLNSASAEPPQVLSLDVPRQDNPTTTDEVPPTRNLEDFIGLFPDNSTNTTGVGPVTTTIPNAGGIGVLLPPDPTTSTEAPADNPAATVGSSTTTSLQVTTTQPFTTTSLGMSTTSTSTSTLPKPTIPSTTTTTTTTIPPTTTTVPTTTTAEASTTTFADDTTTTCGNNGNGKGNC